MRSKTIHIIPFIFLLLAAISCGKDDPVSQQGQNVILDWPGYIWFDADASKTKTAQVESMFGKSFNVIAFKYSSDWATFKATGTPASAMSSSSPYGFKFPTPVACAASTGIRTYTSSDNTNPVEWDGNMKYSFFAYYPALSADDPSGTVTRVTDQTTAGVPAIKYTVPSPVGGYMNAADVPDVMTAYTYDAQNTGAGAVSLNFKHRLCLFCVEARNLKTTEATISNLVLTITSNWYGDVTIPLDGSAIQPGTIINNNFVCRMQPTTGTGAVVTVEQFGSDGTSANTLVSHPNNHIAFIPQNPDDIIDPNSEPKTKLGNLTGKLDFNWNGSAKSQTFTATKSFLEGKKYAFVITIAADDAISVDIRESEDWEENSSDIIFE